MAEFTDFTFASSTGENTVYARKCVPEGQVRGVVQIAHGVAEHIGRYEEFMGFLAENGFAAVANDHLGHGKTATNNVEKGLFALKNGWTYAVDDMARLHDIMQAEFPGVPYILFGHSMGSFLTRTYLIRYPEKYDLAILSGTGHQSKALIFGGCIMADTLCRVKGAGAWGDTLNKVAFGSYCDRIDNPRTPCDWLSRDEAVVDRYMADENCGFVCKNGLYRDMMHGIRFIMDPKNLERMDRTKPVYFMSGKEDPVGDYGEGVERAYKAFCNAGCMDVKMKLYPGGRHEMLNEINKDEVYRDILEWINSKLS
ncbi:MAG: lysophospholipase [Oscillospiraceae bacterium]|nr:lysophospholipase [Oscillospiraceae bacterium]